MRRGDAAASPVDLLGRGDEWQMLRGHLDAARSGRGSAVRIVGEPGIGKTALLQALATAADKIDMLVLRTRGAQSEQQLTFSAVHRLVEPVRHRIADLPAGHGRAMDAAFGLSSDGRVPERFFVALALLELVTAVSSDRPVLMVVDDRHWLDPASRDVIDFVARRINGEPVVVVCTERPTVQAPRDDPGEVLTLHGLGAAAALQLLQATAPYLTPTDRDAVLDGADGNPLALVELPRAANVGGGQGPVLQRLAPRLDEVFGARVQALPAEVRMAVLVAALHDSDATDEAVAAVGRVTTGRSPLALLRDAERAGLLRVDSEHVRFRHPLVRAAAADQASTEDRRAAHEALAAVVTADPQRAEWHRGSSMSDPAETTAEDLGAAAERGADRGDAAFARALFEKAVRLSTDLQRRSHRLLRVAELAFELGNWDDVKPIIASIREGDLSPVDRARLVGLEMAFDDGAPDGEAAVHRFVTSARDAIQAGDDRLAAGLLVVAARNTYWGATAEQLGDEILQAAAQLGDDGAVQGLVVVIESFMRPFASAPAIIESLETLAQLDLDDEAIALFAQAGFVVGDFQRSLQMAQRSSDGLRRDGRLAVLAAALVLQSFSALYLGRWDLTYTASEEALRLAEETHQPVWAACARLGQANLLALRGQRSEAEALAAEVERTAVLTGNAALMNGVQLSRGFAALGAGDPEDACTQLARMFDRSDFAWQSPQCAWAIDYFVEAAVLSGQLDAARTVLTDMEQLTAGTSPPGVLRALTLAHLLIDPGADGAYDAASSVPSTPWHRARRDLVYGSWLRRHHDGSAARALLNSAAAIFEALDAPAWAERATNELAATGVRRTTRNQPEPWSRLSAQELQVAMLAAEGLTNREIGARLYLSSRTISSHLYHVYPKLGITSRAQLHLVLQGARA